MKLGPETQDRPIWPIRIEERSLIVNLSLDKHIMGHHQEQSDWSSNGFENGQIQSESSWVNVTVNHSPSNPAVFDHGMNRESQRLLLGVWSNLHLAFLEMWIRSIWSVCPNGCFPGNLEIKSSSKSFCVRFWRHFGKLGIIWLEILCVPFLVCARIAAPSQGALLTWCQEPRIDWTARNFTSAHFGDKIARRVLPACTWLVSGVSWQSQIEWNQVIWLHNIHNIVRNIHLQKPSWLNAKSLGKV